MVAKLGIRTHLHAIRHYSATELLASGSTCAPSPVDSGTAAAA
jgi:hypothetical protein